MTMEEVFDAHDGCERCIHVSEPDVLCNGCYGLYGENDTIPDDCKDNFQADEIYEKIANNPYWNKISEVAAKQRKRGIETYGQGLEENTWSLIKRIDYLTEELIDALMYMQWIKEAILGKEEEHE